ncbi:methylmalonyl-CoA mutase small subunit [Enemella sp. A6]|uniref:methylmalonyl-CoA mutase small subunit n=1 Tax=Enemella sp. A6 TaxID=3440152 RepID=UPI003EBF223D
MSDNDLLKLAGDFSVPSREDWEAEVLKVLNRRRPEGKELSIEQAMARLRTTTVDGLTIEPLYTEGPEHIGHPGVAPFTRGAEARGGTVQPWDVCQLYEAPDAKEGNKSLLTDLRGGTTSVWARVDSDALAATDLATLLEGVRTDIAPVLVTSTDDQWGAAEALAAIWREAGTAPAPLSNLGIDPLAEAARTGAEPDLSRLAEAVTLAGEFAPARALTVDVLPYDNAGAGEVDALALPIATGVAYLRALAEAGISAAAGFEQIMFRVPANADQFMTIARLRALRRLWHRVGEVLEVPQGHRAAHQQAVTSWRMISRDDPYVNLLRGTIATFAAAVGGADSIVTLPFDTAHGLPNTFSRRMARNTQLLAAEESHVGRVADPAGGSWYVESLTDQLAQAAWARFQEIEAAGGMVEALKSGRIAEDIAATAADRAKRLAVRKQNLTGVNAFPMEDEKPIPNTPRPEAPERNGLPARRDAEMFEALRDRSTNAGTRPQVFMACLGTRRDFGAREQFTGNVLLVAGIARPQSEGGTPDEIAAKAKEAGAKVAVLCSSAKVYAEQAVDVARALKGVGVEKVYLAGRLTEVGSDEAAEVIDGEVFDGMDVVEFLESTLDQLGVAK